jgi:hypothetical protein
VAGKDKRFAIVLRILQNREWVVSTGKGVELVVFSISDAVIPPYFATKWEMGFHHALSIDLYYTRGGQRTV